MSYRKVSLREVCDTLSGYTPRGRLEQSPTGGTPAIQLRDLGDGPFDPLSAPHYDLNNPHRRYLAGAGDLVFRARGDRNTAVLIDLASAATAVAILPLVILRPRRALVDPRYLKWAIDQAPAQRYFDKCALGTNIRMIPKSALDDLEIELPNRPVQELIVEVDALARREYELTRELAEKRLEMTGLALLSKLQSTGNQNDVR